MQQQTLLNISKNLETKAKASEFLRINWGQPWIKGGNVFSSMDPINDNAKLFLK